MERITSRHNAAVKEFRALADSASRRRGSGEDNRMLLDGAHLLQEALEAGVPIDVVAVRDDLSDSVVGVLASRAAARGARLLSVTDSILSAISPVRQASGVVAIARRCAKTLEAAFDHPPQLVLILSGIQDPGNLGAIVRAADACGVTGVVTSDRGADPFGWKALRGSMGSAFRVHVAARQSLEAAATMAKRHDIRLYAAVPRDGTPLPRCNLSRASAVLLGGEGAGLPTSLLALADERLTIPMRPSVESLNVATAAALIAYEAQRQRAGGAS
jgi:RNA methyltransferase, TrmH family